MLDDVKAVRLNGSILIQDIEKQVCGTSAVVKYLVPDWTPVKSYELLDESGTVLTKASMDIPGAVRTVLTHTIPLREGK